MGQHLDASQVQGLTTADEVREALLNGFAQRLARVPDHLLHSVTTAEAETLGAKAVVSALAPRIWADVVGDRLTTADLVRILGVSRQALAKRVASGTLLGLPARGTTIYPRWQFDLAVTPVRVHPVVAEAFAAWVEEAGSLDHYAVASWAKTDQPELGMTPVDCLSKGPDFDIALLVESARRTAERLSQ